MDAADLIQIASYSNAAQAEMVRGLLAEHGISACVDGANTNRVLSHVGSALGGVRLLVRQADVKPATTILESLENDVKVPGTPWFCGPCQVEVDADFEVCWSCGKPRAEVETTSPVVMDIEERTAPPGGTTAEIPLDNVPDANPYVAPRGDPTRAPDTDVYDSSTRENTAAEARLTSAWRAAVIGLAIFPFSIYSMYLLVRASTLTTRFSPRGRRRFFGALLLNLVSGIFWGLIVFGAPAWA